MKNKRVRFDILPVELKRTIFSFFKPQDLSKSLYVSKEWNMLSQKRINELKAEDIVGESKKEIENAKRILLNRKCNSLLDGENLLEIALASIEHAKFILSKDFLISKIDFMDLYNLGKESYEIAEIIIHDQALSEILNVNLPRRFDSNIDEEVTYLEILRDHWAYNAPDKKL